MFKTEIEILKKGTSFSELPPGAFFLYEGILHLKIEKGTDDFGKEIDYNCIEVKIGELRTVRDERIIIEPVKKIIVDK